MESTIQWDNEERTILRVTYEGSWDWDVYTHTRAQFVEAIATVGKPVDVIAVFNGVIIPADIFSHYREFGGGPAFTSQNVRRVIVVWQDPLVKHLFEIFSAIFPHTEARVLLADTLEEAYQKLGLR